MKRTICILLSLMVFLIPIGGCSGNEPSDTIDDMLFRLEDELSDYQKNSEPSKSVLDTLDLMLDHFVSGLSTPASSSIQNIILDPDDQDAQNIIAGATTSVKDETELEALILQSLKNVDKSVCFEVIGSWYDDDLLYDIVYRRVHDVYMIDAFGLDYYSISSTVNGTNQFCELTFYYLDNNTPDEIRAMRLEIESNANKVISDLGLAGKSDYEIVSAIDQYLCDHVYYPDLPYITHDFTPYGALIEGRSVCEGYARSAKILCDICGVDCYYVTGYCDNDPVNGGHAWNLVNVDGNWYQLDITWNDGGGNKSYFLVTDDYMSLSREWDRSRYPASASTAYS